MTFPFIIRSPHHRAKGADYKSKYEKVVQYLNETSHHSRQDRKIEKAVAIFFLLMIVLISVMVAVTSYFE